MNLMPHMIFSVVCLERIRVLSVQNDMDVWWWFFSNEIAVITEVDLFVLTLIF